MLNDVLAVCVAGTAVVVIATILGAVELLRKAVAAIGGRWSCLQAWLRRGSPGSDEWRERVSTWAHDESRREPVKQRRTAAPCAKALFVLAKERSQTELVGRELGFW